MEFVKSFGRKLSVRRCASARRRLGPPVAPPRSARAVRAANQDVGASDARGRKARRSEAQSGQIGSLHDRCAPSKLARRPSVPSRRRFTADVARLASPRLALCRRNVNRRRFDDRRGHLCADGRRGARIRRPGDLSLVHDERLCDLLQRHVLRRAGGARAHLRLGLQLRRRDRRRVCSVSGAARNAASSVYVVDYYDCLRCVVCVCVCCALLSIRRDRTFCFFVLASRLVGI